MVIMMRQMQSYVCTRESRGTAKIKGYIQGQGLTKSCKQLQVKRGIFRCNLNFANLIAAGV